MGRLALLPGRLVVAMAVNIILPVLLPVLDSRVTAVHLHHRSGGRGGIEACVSESVGKADV